MFTEKKKTQGTVVACGGDGVVGGGAWRRVGAFGVIGWYERGEDIPIY